MTSPREDALSSPPAIGDAYRADAPIENAGQDELNRGPFVEELARFVVGWAGAGAKRTSYVLGLFGAWGSGKTSILNLLTERLQATEEAPDVLVFSPWQFTSDEILAAAFFRDLSGALGKRDDEKDYKQAAHLWRSYAARLGAVSSVVPALSKGLVVWGVLAGAALVASTGAFLDVLGLTPALRLIGSLFVALVLTLVGVFGELSGQIAEVYDAKSARAKRTLDEHRRDIRDHMRTLARPLLVAIDDLDRLEPDELRLVLQLVRSNSDVPNLIFLLLVDRDRARQILGRGHSPDEATGLLEKVVQTEIDVPSVPQSTINQFVEDTLLTPAVLGPPWSPLASGVGYHLTHSVERMTSTYVRDLRGATRLLNAVSFQSARLRHGGMLTVYPADLVLIETLRLYEPTVFGRLVSNQTFLTERQHFRATQKDDRKARVEALVAGASNEAAAKAALLFLFDSVADALGPGYRFGPSRSDWQAAGRLQHHAHFARYFTTHTPDHALSLEDAETLMKTVREGNDVGALLDAHRGNASLVAALEVVSGVTPESPPESVQILLAAVFPHLEVVTAAYGGGGLFSDAGRLGAGTDVVERALERLPNSADRASTLQDLAGEFPHTLSYLAMFPNNVFSPADVQHDHGLRLLECSDSGVLRSVVGAACRDRLLSLSPEEVLDYTRPLELYVNWKKWYNESEALTWLCKGIEGSAPNALAARLSMFVVRDRDPGAPALTLDANDLRSVAVGDGGLDDHTDVDNAVRRAVHTALVRTDVEGWAVPLLVAARSSFPEVR